MVPVYPKILAKSAIYEKTPPLYIYTLSIESFIEYYSVKTVLDRILVRHQNMRSLLISVFLYVKHHISLMKYIFLYICNTFITPLYYTSYYYPRVLLP